MLSMYSEGTLSKEFFVRYLGGGGGAWGGVLKNGIHDLTSNLFFLGETPHFKKKKPNSPYCEISPPIFF
jgi:hypothetical protein